MRALIVRLMRVSVGLVVAAWGLGALGGCSSPARSAMFSVPPGGYAEAFEHTKDVVRAWGFELERVDAARGVITSRPAAASGLATPWIGHAQGLDATLTNTLRGERRVVRVGFVGNGGVGGGGSEVDDLRGYDGAVTGTVEVGVLVLDRPWRRADPTSIRFTSVALDPVAINRGEAGVREYEAGLDEGLAARLARSIDRLTRGGGG